MEYGDLSPLCRWRHEPLMESCDKTQHSKVLRTLFTSTGLFTAAKISKPRPHCRRFCSYTGMDVEMCEKGDLREGERRGIADLPLACGTASQPRLNFDIIVRLSRLACVGQGNSREVPMTKPCNECDAYIKDEAECSVLVRLQATHPADRDGKAASIEELFFQRPCRFSPYIMRMAKYFINERGLGSQIEPCDIHNDVVVKLMETDFQRVGPTYEDFRAYVTAMTRNAVHYRYVQIYGNYCCGTCAFFLKKSKGLPNRCGKLQPVLGQQCVQVNYSTNPKDVSHSEGKGCPYYSSKQFVGLDELNLVTVPEVNEVQETLEYMESLGPRQRKQAGLLRLMLERFTDEEEGVTVEKIALRTGKNRATISKELHGTNEKEDDGTGNKIAYHQAGAFDVFQAIYRGAIFELKRKRKDLWEVVSRRDFSPDEKQKSFNEISKELSNPECRITKREAIERYIAGWDLDK